MKIALSICLIVLLVLVLALQPVSGVGLHASIKDIKPPASVTNLHNITYATTYINWTWNDPADTDFANVIVYIDGVFKSTVSKGIQYYNAAGFAPDTEHTIATRTVDISGNVNQTWINHTARTNIAEGDTKPPIVSITSPSNNSNITVFDNTVTLTVSDDSPPISVALYLNDLLVNTSNVNVSSSSLSIQVSYISNTTNVLYATATDVWNNMNTSNILDVKVASNQTTVLINCTAGNSTSVNLTNQTEIEVTANETINGTITVRTDSNITSLNASINSTNKLFGLKAGEVHLDRYVDVNVTDITPSQLSSVNITIFYTKEDLDTNNIDEDLLKIFWWNGSAWRPLDTVTANYSTEGSPPPGPTVLGIFPDKANKKLTVQLNHFSTFTLIGSVKAAPPGGSPEGPSGGGVGGGGVGGGGVVTSEPYDNIAKYETRSKDIIANTPVTYIFTAPEHGIYEIVLTGKESENDIALRVETLKGTSKLVTLAPPGTVYKNVNIWAGTKRIKEVLIRFKVENSWLTSNNLAGGDVKLVKWDGSQWVQLETTEKTKDSSYTCYEAKTDSLSIFAITGLKGVVVPTATPAVEGTETQDKPTITPVPTKKVPGFELAMAIAMLSVVYMLRRKRRMKVR